MRRLLFHVTLVALVVVVVTSPQRWSRNSIIPHELTDAVHGVKMGVSHVDCDDAKVSLYHIVDYRSLLFTL